MRISKIILLAVISILGCQDSSLKSKADEELISSLLSSNEIIDDINQRSILSFDNMLKDPITHDKAENWYTKADSARKMSNIVSSFIDEIRNDFIKNSSDKKTTLKKLVELPQRLSRLRESLLSLDSSFTNEFKYKLPLKNYEGNKANPNNWVENTFDNKTKTEALLSLTKLQNDIKTSEAMILNYIHYHAAIDKIIYEDYSEFDAIALANSEILKPGQELVIFAGMGDFTRRNNPKIKIDGRIMPFNERSMVEYKTTVNKPGNYEKKVEISYTTLDGIPFSMYKIIKYEVRNCIEK